MKNLFKFTIILLLVIVNSVQAQIKPTTAAERSNGFQKRKLLEKDTTLNSIKFRNVGPGIMSGRVVDVDVNPNDPTEFYVAYATGGLWYTKNNGQSLVPVFDKENVFGIGDIAVNWKDGIIWIGTGEANSSRSSYSGLGVYKSVDKGKTWEHLGLTESHHIGKINLHPTDKNIAWVINPTNPDELYAAMWYRTRRAWNFEESGKTSGIYKSTDGGNNWKVVTTAGSGFPAGDGLGRIGLAVFAKSPNIIYATLDNQGRRPDTAKKKVDTNYVLKNFKDLTKESFANLDNNKLDSFLVDYNFKEKYTAASVKELVKNDKIKPTEIYNYLFDANTALFETPIIGCEVYRSDNAGLSWRKVNTKGLNTYNTYGYYFGKISVSNTNEDKVVISGFDLLLSSDGGKTFTSTDNEATHPDWHGCWMNPNKDSHWIAGNDGGCNVTYDNGEHWFKANTPSVGQFYKITVDDARPYNIYGGLQDNGTWYGPSTAKDKDQWDYEGVYPWKQIGGGDGMQVQVDTRDNKTAYTGSQFGFYGRRSTEGGRRLFIYPRPDLGEAKYRFNWQTPIWLSRHNQDIFYYGTNRFHRSLQKGENLEPLSADLTNGGTEGDVPFGTATTLVESPMKFGLIYVGTDDGNIHVSKDAGYNWTKINTNLPKGVQGLYVSRVTPSAFKEGRVYVSLNGYRNDHFGAYLFASEDYGTTWTQLGTDLPMEPINVVTEDQKKENIIYVGTDNGLYASFNMGKSFLTLDNNLPRVPVHDMAVQQRENELVIGTHNNQCSSIVSTAGMSFKVS
ncbi:MAG: glycosyl hydrolase [Chitinophagaceae bacterium]|nr:glycosyl hydrolase [Chitinophagaceae bacterium]